MVELVDMLPVQNILGEGVLWNARSARLWWTDIEGRRLFRYDPAARGLDEIATPERLCSFAFVAGGERLVAAFESGLALYDPANGAVEWLYRLEHGAAPVRFNDGRTDRQGRFWAGTTVEGDGREPLGRLHCLDRSGRVTRQTDPVFVSNALCTSPDGSRLYFADSPRRTIFAYDLDRISGVLSNRRLFVRTPEGAFPDGANVDREGFVWNAHWGAGQIVRYAPDGSIDRMVEVPASQPSSIAFGGPEMNLLFVTTARDGLKGDILLRQPSAGNLFVYKTDITGLPDADFIFDQTK
ncbi:MAG: SMP-30/gluconolactonase/LRE family protein [Rhizomicrobium sp.]